MTEYELNKTMNDTLKVLIRTIVPILEKEMKSMNSEEKMLFLGHLIGNLGGNLIGNGLDDAESSVSSYFACVIALSRATMGQINYFYKSNIAERCKACIRASLPILNKKIIASFDDEPDEVEPFMNINESVH